MKRCRLIFMIAAVATAITLGPAAKARPDPTATPRSIVVPLEKPRDTAAQTRCSAGAARIKPFVSRPTVKPGATAADIERLIRIRANNTEIVRFADPHAPPVRVVRGGKLPLPMVPANRRDQIVTVAGMRKQQVHVLRGGPIVETAAVATVAMAPAAAPEARPIRPAVQIVTFADRYESPVTVLRGARATPIDADQPLVTSNAELDLFRAARGADLDRVAFAVDGAESSHGADPGMWRPEFDGPQGPMQVSAAAASDSGGGDRFDLTQNRQLGRAYLARLFRRYGNWPDAIAAYNWGPGNLDAWIAQGRPAAGLPLGVERYRERVLRDGAIRQGPGSPLSRTGWQLPTP